MVLKDACYGLRQLRRTPAISLVAVLSLAIGIGANTAIFTLINAVMLQNLPVRDPGRLVLFYDDIADGVYSGNGFHGDIFSYASWEYFRDHNESFEGLSAFKQGSDRLLMHLIGSSDSGAREQARGHLVSGNYFAVLGVRAAFGRMLTTEDDTLAAPPVAVISYGFWNSRFHLDRAVIGKAVSLNGAPFTVVGVTPPEFFGERVGKSPDFWLPLTRQSQVLQRESWLQARDVYWLNLIGRLKPGVTMQRAQATLNTQLQQFYTAQAGTHITADQRRQIRKAHIELKAGGRGISWMRFMYSKPLHVLMAVVALVFLIACANVATLLLARAAARQQEMFTRLALGASRTRLLRQLLTESVLLSLLGGAAGVALAWWSVKALVVMIGITVVKIRPDVLVLSFTLGISVLTGIGFGLFPALRSSRVKSPDFGMSRFNPAHAFVVLQVALSSVLLVGAGLLTHSLLGLERQDLGFDREHLLLIRTDPRLAGYQPAELFPLYRRIHDRLNALPGVISACIARFSPLSGNSSSNNFSIQGYTPTAGKEMTVFTVPVGPRFFETLGVRLLLGRTISPRDTPASPMVAVVSESFVRQYLPKENPLGRRFSLGSPLRPPIFEIIGVVGDSKYYQINESAKPMAFFSAWQAGGVTAYVGEMLVRTAGDPSGATAEVKALLHEIDSKLPILNVTTLSAQVYESLRQERMIATLCSFFGLLALLLTAIGLYGTMTYAVARRTKEIGIRMALGAQRRAVLWRVLRESVVLIVLGLGFGLPLALGATRWLKSFLFGISIIDPVGISTAILLLAAVATLAGYLPARRATKVDPMVALRHE